MTTPTTEVERLRAEVENLKDVCRLNGEYVRAVKSRYKWEFSELRTELEDAEEAARVIHTEHGRACEAWAVERERLLAESDHTGALYRAALTSLDATTADLAWHRAEVERLKQTVQEQAIELITCSHCGKTKEEDVCDVACQDCDQTPQLEKEVERLTSTIERLHKHNLEPGDADAWNSCLDMMSKYKERAEAWKETALAMKFTWEFGEGEDEAYRLLGAARKLDREGGE